jgi:hypothetical protein
VYNPKGKLNEWCQKHGHPSLTYVTENTPSVLGFVSAVELPIDGANGLEHVTQAGITKKEAEAQAAAQGILVLQQIGLFDAPSAVPPGKAKLRKLAEAARAKAVDPAALKEEVLQIVHESPCLPVAAYHSMLPEGETKPRVRAALLALEQDGLVAKTASTSDIELDPFWHPVDFTGPLGGTVDEEHLIEDTSFPPADLMMILYDLLAEKPHQSCVELTNMCGRQGRWEDRKVIQNALLRMEKDGHATKTVGTSFCPGQRWPTWQTTRQA